MAKRGPKIIEINWVDFDKLCHMQAPLSEIASWFDCSEDTIERRVKEEHGMKFADYYAQKRGKGKVALRRKQFDVAMSGDKTMLIWRGKQYLGQQDQVHIEEEIELVDSFERNETNKTNE